MITRCKSISGSYISLPNSLFPNGIVIDFFTIADTRWYRLGFELLDRRWQWTDTDGHWLRSSGKTGSIIIPQRGEGPNCRSSGRRKYSDWNWWSNTNSSKLWRTFSLSSTFESRKRKDKQGNHSSFWCIFSIQGLNITLKRF